MKITLVTLALAAALPATTVLADARIDFRSTEGSGASIQSVYVGHGKLRTDADAGSSVIMDPAAREMIILQHAQRKYIRMGREQIAQMSGALDAAMAQMEQAMANMPPEARAQMQGMMGAALGGAGGQPMVKVVETGRSDTVAGHSCRIYETQMQGRAISETCMGGVNVLTGLSAADRATLDGALAMSKELAESLSQGPLGSMVDLGPFQAGLFPLRVTDIENGRRSTSEFAGIDTGSLPADKFAVPAGYREEKIEIPNLGR